MEKKRYILFVTEQYYPLGGMKDAVESFELEEYSSIQKEYPIREGKSMHIFDTETFSTYSIYSDGYPDLASYDNDDY